MLAISLNIYLNPGCVPTCQCVFVLVFPAEKWSFLPAHWRHLPSSFTPDNSSEDQRISICPHPSSRRISYFQPPEPITLDQEPSIHTSQNDSINKSPLWYLSEARDLRLPLCLVEFVRPFGATFVWLMCLRWIRSTQKPFKSQSSAFQSNAGRTMRRILGGKKRPNKF